jgi:spore coat polysaccharide biosynthesis protein SpsF
VATRTGIVLQARMASARLPGKALSPIEGRPILEHCLRRLMESEASVVILATTDRGDDDALVEVARRMRVDVFRGDAVNVLDRFVRCADRFRLDVIVRATADNPGVDMMAPARVVSAMRGTGAQYVYEQGLPLGGAVEGVTRDALVVAAALCRDAYDQEHVTTFVRRRTDLFRHQALAAPLPLTRPELRLTVDTPRDLDYMRELYRGAGSDRPSLVELIAAADRAASAVA